MKYRRGISIEKEILHKQMELIAEDSAVATGNELANLSVAMCEIDRRLVHRHLLIAKNLIVFTQFLVCFIVFFKKFLRR